MHQKVGGALTQVDVMLCYAMHDVCTHMPRHHGLKGWLACLLLKHRKAEDSTRDHGCQERYHHQWSRESKVIMSVHHHSAAALALLGVLWTASISPVAAGLQSRYVPDRIADHGQFRDHPAFSRFDIKLGVSRWRRANDEQEKLAMPCHALLCLALPCLTLPWQPRRAKQGIPSLA